MDELTRPFLEHPERAGILCDFDGTLAPIVLDPAAARPLPGAADLLHTLAERYARVAVISGRPVPFLTQHLTAGNLILAGLYGIERCQADGSIVTSPEAETWRQVIEAVADRAEQELPPTVGVERKGLTVTLHVRGDPAQEETVASWADDRATQTGLAVHPGRQSWELRPPIRADKGTTALELARGLDAVCFLGDDVGDLPAFAALRHIRRESHVHAVNVGVRSEEAPPELFEIADVVVDGPEGALGWLRQLLNS